GRKAKTTPLLTAGTQTRIDRIDVRLPERSGTAAFLVMEQFRKKHSGSRCQLPARRGRQARPCRGIDAALAVLPLDAQHDVPIDEPCRHTMAGPIDTQRHLDMDTLVVAFDFR